jgi:hypothetical protein
MNSLRVKVIYLSGSQLTDKSSSHWESRSILLQAQRFQMRMGVDSLSFGSALDFLDFHYSD